REELLGDRARQGIKPRSATAGQDDAFHDDSPSLSVCSTLREPWKGFPSFQPISARPVRVRPKPRNAERAPASARSGSLAVGFARDGLPRDAERNERLHRIFHHGECSADVDTRGNQRLYYGGQVIVHAPPSAFPEWTGTRQRLLEMKRGRLRGRTLELGAKQRVRLGACAIEQPARDLRRAISLLDHGPQRGDSRTHPDEELRVG